MHRMAARFQHGAGEGADRTFAVGAGDVNDRRQFAFGMAEIGQQPQDPIQHQVDLLGMECQKPFENCVALGDAHEARPLGAGARNALTCTTAGAGNRILGRARFIKR